MNENGSTAAAVPLLPGQAPTPAIKIDDGVPIPKAARGPGKSAVRLAMETAEVGQSFLVPILDGGLEKAAMNAGRTASVLTPKKFIRRVLLENGARVVRVWRTA